VPGAAEGDAEERRGDHASGHAGEGDAGHAQPWQAGDPEEEGDDGGRVHQVLHAAGDHDRGRPAVGAEDGGRGDVVGLEEQRAAHHHQERPRQRGDGWRELHGPERRPGQERHRRAHPHAQRGVERHGGGAGARRAAVVPGPEVVGDHHRAAGADHGEEHHR
jgi:hypothetical protein